MKCELLIGKFLGNATGKMQTVVLNIENLLESYR